MLVRRKETRTNKVRYNSENDCIVLPIYVYMYALK